MNLTPTPPSHLCKLTVSAAWHIVHVWCQQYTPGYSWAGNNFYFQTLDDMIKFDSTQHNCIVKQRDWTQLVVDLGDSCLQDLPELVGWCRENFDSKVWFWTFTEFHSVINIWFLNPENATFLTLKMANR